MTQGSHWVLVGFPERREIGDRAGDWCCFRDDDPHKVSTKYARCGHGDLVMQAQQQAHRRLTLNVRRTCREVYR